MLCGIWTWSCCHRGVGELETRGCLGELERSGTSPSARGVEGWCARVWAWMGPGGVTKPRALSTPRQISPSQACVVVLWREEVAVPAMPPLSPPSDQRWVHKWGGLGGFSVLGSELEIRISSNRRLPLAILVYAGVFPWQQSGDTAVPVQGPGSFTTGAACHSCSLSSSYLYRKLYFFRTVTLPQDIYSASIEILASPYFHYLGGLIIYLK